MLSTDDLQADHQKRLLKSLQKKVSISTIPKATLETKPKITTLYRSGRGSPQDHMMLIKNYVCQCGHQITDISHSVNSRQNGTAIDTYSMECDNCGDKEEVNFMSLRKTLQEATGQKITVDRRDKRLFPYV